MTAGTCSEALVEQMCLSPLSFFGLTGASTATDKQRCWHHPPCDLPPRTFHQQNYISLGLTIRSSEPLISSVELVMSISHCSRLVSHLMPDIIRARTHAGAPAGVHGQRLMSFCVDE
ncbi:hypothetical protein MIND_00409300 [Mycena indigotica]|uniref:Uncharacterized protein n=1 Tax=Mycena indigotica TaxID=2126181 RepID=A0A8H6SYD5_9AGAR|nr:uncharacterized protein MIND_00409300 [Mycena indigotica]KAF7306190.1 hypothetical protein MIND_00409300 [Mycena indigotica]